MTYKTLLFDVDDTILDFQDTEHEALTALFAEQGLTMDLEMKQTYQEVNHGLWQQFEQGKLSRDQVVNERFGLFLKSMGESSTVKRWKNTIVLTWIKGINY